MSTYHNDCRRAAVRLFATEGHRTGTQEPFNAERFALVERLDLAKPFGPPIAPEDRKPCIPCAAFDCPGFLYEGDPGPFCRACMGTDDEGTTTVSDILRGFWQDTLWRIVVIGAALLILPYVVDELRGVFLAWTGGGR